MWTWVFSVCGLIKSSFSFAVSPGWRFPGSVKKLTSSVPLSVGETWAFWAKAGNTINGIKNRMKRNFNTKFSNIVSNKNYSKSQIVYLISSDNFIVSLNKEI